MSVRAGIFESRQADGQRRARLADAVDADDAALFVLGAALDALARVAAGARRTARRVDLRSVRTADVAVERRTDARLVAHGLQSGRDARAGDLDAVVGDAPADAAQRVALDRLVAAVVGAAARDEHAVGRHAALARPVLHDELLVLARRLDQRFDALGAAAVGAALERAVAVFVGHALVVARVHRHGHQEGTLAALDRVLHWTAHALGRIVLAVARIVARTRQRSAARVARQRYVAAGADERFALRTFDAQRLLVLQLQVVQPLQVVAARTATLNVDAVG